MLTVATLGMMALGVAGAQGQLPLESTLGTFKVNGNPLLPANATGIQNGAGSLLVPARNLKLKCETSHVTEGAIISATNASAKVTFLECVSLDLKTGVPLPCETAGLKTISAKAIFLPILHGPADGELTYVLAEPQVAGGNFTVVEYKEGTECPLPLKNPVTGSVTAEVSELEGKSPTLLFNPEIQLLTGDVLRYGGFPSYIHGSAKVELTTPHAGQNLGIH